MNEFIFELGATLLVVAMLLIPLGIMSAIADILWPIDKED